MSVLLALILLLTPSTLRGIPNELVFVGEATVCVNQADFEEIIAAIEAGYSGKAVFDKKDGCNNATIAVNVEERLKVFNARDGTRLILVRTKTTDGKHTLYAAIPAVLFPD